MENVLYDLRVIYTIIEIISFIYDKFKKKK
jgi:hypothetical protein